MPSSPTELGNSTWNFREGVADSTLYKLYGCIKLLNVITFSPGYVRLSFMPNDCHLWMDPGESLTLLPRKCDGGYCMDVYKREEVIYREIGGEFEFNSYASPLFRHICSVNDSVTDWVLVFQS